MSDKQPKGKKQAPKQKAQPSGAAKQPTATTGPAIALFPPRPERKQAAPGRRVVLITNLFKISLNAKKPIYRYGLTVEYCGEQKPRPDAGDAKSKQGPKESGPRKIPSTFRHLAVKKAIEQWIASSKPSDYPKNLSFPYVLDNNASCMFALFNVFAKLPAGSKEMEFIVDVPVPSGNQEEVRQFKVKFHDGQILKIQDYVDFCQKKSNASITEISQFSRALNTILHAKISTIEQFVLIQTVKGGSSTVFPYEKNRQFQISPGVMCNSGFSLSSRPTEDGIVLNVANTFAPFYEKNSLIDLVRIRYNWQDFSKPLPPYIIDSLKRELKNKQVEVSHIKYGSHYKKHRIHDISGSAMDKFTLVDQATKTSKQVTIAEYFKMQYPKNAIRFPNLPCIVDAGRKLPMELCSLVEKQRVARKLDGEETASFIKHAALPPEKHFEMVRENVKQLCQHKQPFVDFGLDINPIPIEVEGRELQAYPLMSGSRTDIMPSNGNYIMGRDRFLMPATIDKFCVAFLVDYFVAKGAEQLKARAKDEFLRWYMEAGKMKGVTIKMRLEDVPVDLIQGERQTIERMQENELKTLLKKYITYLNQSKFDHALIVLPKNCPDWLYGYLQYLETSISGGRGPQEKWTRTSCVKYDNFTRKILNTRDNGSMFISNLWLKYNTKLGGVNFALKPQPALPFLNDGVIFISVDVCHPAPGDKLAQSVAAVVGMWDLTSAKMSYCTRIRAQRKMRSQKEQSTVEEVLDIGVMVSDILESYRTKKNKLPAFIIVLRDGVSEGQFEMVSRFELTRIKQALSSKYQLCKQQEPKLVCLVVQKRHKIRFMRKEPVEQRGRDGIKKDYNIQPGTVVDSKIIRPNEFSFYMAPHKAIQGTSRAPYIYIIYDEIGLGQDSAQAMILVLSYLSPRCTKSTSIPTPVNLADLAAERGKNIVVSWNAENNPKSSQEESMFQKLNQYLADMADANYKNTLYYV